MSARRALTANQAARTAGYPARTIASTNTGMVTASDAPSLLPANPTSQSTTARPHSTSRRCRQIWGAADDRRGGIPVPHDEPRFADGGGNSILLSTGVRGRDGQRARRQAGDGSLNPGQPPHTGFDGAHAVGAVHAADVEYPDSIGSAGRLHAVTKGADTVGEGRDAGCGRIVANVRGARGEANFCLADTGHGRKRVLHRFGALSAIHAPDLDPGQDPTPFGRGGSGRDGHQRATWSETCSSAST